MLRIHFTADDLARLTIAAEPHPMWEALLSLHMSQRTAGELAYGGWRAREATRVPRGDLALLRELAPPNGYSPDFLTPEHGFAGLTEGIDRVMSTPKPLLRKELDYLIFRTSSTLWIANWLSQAGRAIVAAAKSVRDD